jgi:hypothetical protein
MRVMDRIEKRMQLMDWGLVLLLIATGRFGRNRICSSASVRTSLLLAYRSSERYIDSLVISCVDDLLTNLSNPPRGALRMFTEQHLDYCSILSL